MVGITLAIAASTSFLSAGQIGGFLIGWAFTVSTAIPRPALIYTRKADENG